MIILVSVLRLAPTKLRRHIQKQCAIPYAACDRMLRYDATPCITVKGSQGITGTGRFQPENTAT